MEKIYRQGVRPDIPYDMRYAMAKPVGVPYSGLDHANAEHNAEESKLRGVVLVGEHRVSRRNDDHEERGSCSLEYITETPRISSLPLPPQ